MSVEDVEDKEGDKMMLKKMFRNDKEQKHHMAFKQSKREKKL